MRASCRCLCIGDRVRFRAAGWAQLNASVVGTGFSKLVARRPWQSSETTVPTFRGQTRNHWHSATLQKFFTHRTHKKFCPGCGKPCALLLEVCNFCGQVLLDEHIQPTGRDPMVDALLGGAVHGGGSFFKELHRSYHALVLEHRFPVGRVHLLALPKGNCYDVRQLRRKDVPLLRQLRARGVASLKAQLGLSERAPEPASLVCGFSYPADYNQLHMHLVVPPFSNFALFERRVFFPYGEVEAELERRGVVRRHTEVFNPDVEDAYLARLIAFDKAAREAQAQPRRELEAGKSQKL